MGKKYHVIYADPPWQYRNNKRRGSADNHYNTMSIEELHRLPIPDVTTKDAVLFMWFTAPMAVEAISLVEAWGFKLVTTKAFTWVKLIKNYKQRLITDTFIHEVDMITALQNITFFGLGSVTRGNTEDCLFAIKGNGLQRKHKDVRQLVISPVSDHSKKPHEVRERITKLYGDVNRLELFARGELPSGWDGWGNECNNAITLNLGENDVVTEIFEANVSGNV